MRGLSCRYYTTTLHKGAFYLPAYVEEMLEDVEGKLRIFWLVTHRMREADIVLYGAPFDSTTSLPARSQVRFQGGALGVLRSGELFPIPG